MGWADSALASESSNAALRRTELWDELSPQEDFQMAEKHKTKFQCNEKKKNVDVTFETDKGKITKGVDKCPACGTKHPGDPIFAKLQKGAGYP